MKTSHAGIII